jgi:hypothetical protein
VDPNISFPGESGEYRGARNELLEAEVELRRTIERVAAKRRALPAGGTVPADYVFEEAAEGGGEVRFSDLFEPGSDTLVIYSFMFPRWSGDTRPGPGGETGKLHSRRLRVRPAPRSSTRSMVPPSICAGDSTSLSSRSQFPSGSAHLPGSGAGAT